MANDIYFRSALSGYNKSDVINFIEKLNAEQVERVNELNEKLRSSQSEARKLSTELDEMKKKCSELESQLAVSGEEIAVNKEKAEKFDSMQGSYADIMLEAEHSSKQKVRAAEEKADIIMKEALEAKKKIIAENKEIIEASKTEFVALLDKLTSSLDKTLQKIENENE